MWFLLLEAWPVDEVSGGIRTSAAVTLSSFQYLCPLNCKAARIVNPCIVCTVQARPTLSRGQALCLLYSCLLGYLPYSFHLLYSHPLSLFCLPLVGDQYVLAHHPIRNCPQAWQPGKCETPLISFPCLRNQSLVLPVVQCLKAVTSYFLHC